MRLLVLLKRNFFTMHGHINVKYDFSVEIDKQTFITFCCECQRQCF